MVIENPWTELRELTAARLALGRCGHSLPTRELLRFQLAHAQARDAVHQALDPSSLRLPQVGMQQAGIPQALVLRSMAPDRATYLRRPDLGRRLSPESEERIAQTARGDWDAVIVVADGLSATAVHRHAAVVLAGLLHGPLEGSQDALRPPLAGWRIAPTCIVLEGRVAIGDEIGERFGARLALVLIGERPGLSSPDSLGAYLTWAPRRGRTDAERNCISNIRNGGLQPALAAERIATLMRAALARQMTGVRLGQALEIEN